METSQYEIYAPLHGFHWDGDLYELGQGVSIRRLNKKPDLRGTDEQLDENEQKSVLSAPHWVLFKWSEGNILAPAEITNLVLIALWLVKPTQSYVAFRFELGNLVANPGKTRSRLLDRFTWVPGNTDDSFCDSELQSAADYFQIVHKICSARGRLNNALVLTLSGCFAHHWQTVIICYSAATEALLTYSKGGGITGRLSTAYACLTNTNQPGRDVAYKEFNELYNVRSDIMHGRTDNIDPGARLPMVSRAQNVLRNIWRKVLSSRGTISTLEGGDNVRKKYFESLSNGYSPPP